MLSQAFKNFNEIWMTIFAMVLFMSVFIGSIVWTFGVRKRGATLTEASQLPLQEEEFNRGRQ